MNRLYCMVMFCLLSVSGALAAERSTRFTPSDSVQRSAADAAESYAVASLTNDVAHVVAHSHPRYVRAMGGRDALAERLRSIAERNRLTVKEPKSVQLGVPQFEATRRRLYAIVPARVLTEGYPHDILSNDYFVVVSEDQGRTWRAFNTSCGVDVKRILADFPFDRITEVTRSPFVPVRTLALTDPGQASAIKGE